MIDYAHDVVEHLMALSSRQGIHQETDVVQRALVQDHHTPGVHGLATQRTGVVTLIRPLRKTLCVKKMLAVKMDDVDGTRHRLHAD
jgi:hypothetical protein